MNKRTVLQLMAGKLVGHISAAPASLHGAADTSRFWYRYRNRMKQQSRGMQQQLVELQQHLEKMALDNGHLAARQRAMQDLIDKQEFHIHSLMNLQVASQ